MISVDIKCITSPRLKPSKRATVQTKQGNTLMLDYCDGFIYLLNKTATAVVKTLEENECDFDGLLATISQWHEPPQIRRYALLHTLTATGGKLGQGIFPFRSGASTDFGDIGTALTEDKTLTNEQGLSSFLKISREYGLLI